MMINHVDGAAHNIDNSDVAMTGWSQLNGRVCVDWILSVSQHNFPEKENTKKIFLFLVNFSLLSQTQTV